MKRELLKDIRNLLDFHRALGLDGYPRHAVSKKLPVQYSADEKPGKTLDSRPPAVNKASLKTGAAKLSDIETAIRGCTRCRLHESRSRIIFGAGSDQAELFIVGEWPSQEDDRLAMPFSGKAGELFTKMLAAIGLNREKIFCTSLVKCHPTGGRRPQTDELSTCLPYLLRQIDVVSPVLICAMGDLAARTLTGIAKPLLQLRGRLLTFKGIDGREIPLLPTFHPAFLLTNEEMKRASWTDLQIIQKHLQLKKK